MARAGVRAEDIEIVLASHLHFDHAGGFTARDASGAVRPRFPNARYLVNAGEWEDATHPHERNRASYFAENYVPLQEAGVLDLLADNEVDRPGRSACGAPAATRGFIRSSISSPAARRRSSPRICSRRRRT